MTLKKLLKWTGLGLLLLLGVMLVKMLFTNSIQPKGDFAGDPEQDTAVLRRLSEIIQFKTVSFEDSSDGYIKLKELELLYLWMEKSYPNCFASAEAKKIGHSLLLTFKGSNSSLKPALFLAHLDVVPADTSAGNWMCPPFSGKIKGDTVYGRGALDDKSVATAMLEAMEKILTKGKKPLRTIMFAFGHDEETGGWKGAKSIAAYLTKKGVQAEFICDEGFGVMEGLVPGVNKPVALMGIAEKGDVTFKLSVSIAGGHSSMPKRDNATSILSRVLSKIENEELREEITGPQELFFRTIAPEAGFLYRFLFSNMWIASPLVKLVLRQNEKAAATMRTTHATTIIKAGVKANVMPNYAEAYVNCRILPGQSIAELYKLIVRIVDDKRVDIEILPDHNESSGVSPVKGVGWTTVTETIVKSFKGVVVAPALVVTGTDCKNYEAVSQNIYRFTPLRLNNNNLGGIHGANERIAANNYYEAINYYYLLFGKL